MARQFLQFSPENRRKVFIFLFLFALWSHSSILCNSLTYTSLMTSLRVENNQHLNLHYKLCAATQILNHEYTAQALYSNGRI